MMSPQFNLYSQPACSSSVAARALTLNFPASPLTIYSKNGFGVGQLFPSGNDWVKSPAATASIPANLFDAAFPVWWLVDSSSYFIAYSGSCWRLFYTAGLPSAAVPDVFSSTDGGFFSKVDNNLAHSRNFTLYEDAALLVPYFAPLNKSLDISVGGKNKATF